MNNAQLYILLTAVVILLAVLLAPPLRRAIWTLLKLCSGCLFYCVMSFALAPLGIVLALNPVTVVITLILGVPGVIFVILAHSMFM